MITRRRFLAVAGAVAGAGVVSAGCGGRDQPILERIRESGQLRVGIAGEVPYGYLDATGRLTGEGPAVAEVVLRSLGVRTLESVQRPFGQLIDNLLAGHFDIIAAAMRITPARCGRVLFSRPDLLTPTAFLVPKGNPKRIRTFPDVARAQVRVAVVEGSYELDAVRAVGVREDLVQVVGSPNDLFQAVSEGRAQVGSLTDISLRSMLNRHPASKLQVTAGISANPGDRSTQPAAGFAFRPVDAPLRDAFNAALTQLQTSGDWLRVTAPFGVTPANLPPADLTTTDLCSGST